jgi:hypothetical protein
VGDDVEKSADFGLEGEFFLRHGVLEFPIRSKPFRGVICAKVGRAASPRVVLNAGKPSRELDVIPFAPQAGRKGDDRS